MNNGGKKRGGGFLLHLSSQEKINLARHLSIAIKAGLPLFEGLKIIRNQARSRTLLRILDALIDDVNNGQFLADALGRYRSVFGDFFINIIRVGESSGTLAANLLYLADELKKAQDLRRKIRSAMIYPTVILFATMGITAFLVFYIFPKILPIFASLRITLPLTTRIMISVVDFLRANGLWVVLGILAFFGALRLLMLSQKFRYVIHRFYFMIPVVSRLAVHISMANFTRILAILLKSGINIVPAVTVTGKTFRNLVYRRAFEEAATEVQRGEQLSHCLGHQRRFFPPLLVSMIQIGENTGNLEENLNYLSEYYTEEVDNSVKNLTTLLEPLLLLLMGLLVGFVAISIITPIYSVSQGITGA